MHHRLCLPGICMLFKELCVLDVLHTYCLQNELAPLLEHQVQFPRLLNTALFKLLTCLRVSERACEFPTTWSLTMSCCSANCNATVSSSAWFCVLNWPSSLASICSMLIPFLLPLFQLLIWELWPLTLPSCHPVQACKAHIVWRASFCSFHLQGHTLILQKLSFSMSSTLLTAKWHSSASFFSTAARTAAGFFLLLRWFQSLEWDLLFSLP